MYDCKVVQRAAVAWMHAAYLPSGCPAAARWEGAEEVLCLCGHCLWAWHCVWLMILCLTPGVGCEQGGHESLQEAF
jgi:hypothetical protein